ncbi:MAG: hypothetical protein LBM07_06215 [Culturomica sp.]|jgi:hypothetical protein|nr:hypothetical protein [Culturomica sp.]
MRKLVAFTGIYIIFFIFVACLPCAEAQDTKMRGRFDKEILHYFLDSVKLSENTKIEDLADLNGFKQAVKTDIGFGGTLYEWTLSGGRLNIVSNIAFFSDNKLIKAEVRMNGNGEIVKDILAADTNLNVKFNLFFKEPTSDLPYHRDLTNRKAWDKFTENVAKTIGKQTKVNINGVEQEYNLLMNPLSNPYVGSNSEHNPTAIAVSKLRDDGKVDCIMNIIKGYSVSGRVYALQALFELEWMSKYKLSESDRILLSKIIELPLYVNAKDIYGKIHPVSYYKYIKQFILANRPKQSSNVNN